MKCNQKAIKQARDRSVGEKYDQGITIGVKIAALACHKRFGFGKARLKMLDDEITCILKDMTQGATPNTTEYKQNVERGLELLDIAISQIFGGVE